MIRRTTSGSDGSYAFTGLPAGLYRLSASAQGFEEATAADVAIVAGNNRLDVTLTAQTLSSLRTIGSVSTTATRSKFNVSGLAVTTLDPSEIELRNQPNLTTLAEELPGVTVFRDSGSRTPNTDFVIRGSEVETQVVIDGHALSSGVFGTYNTNYANPDVFQTVEVLKGAGLNGVNAGTSAVGTVNLQTRDFASRDEASFKVGADAYQGQEYTGYFNLNFLNNKLSILGVRSYQGFNGPDLATFGNQIGAAPPLNASTLTYTGPALLQWTSDFSNPYYTEANLLKVRYRFTNTTSITAEYLGLYGGYPNQGGSYGLYYGNFPVAQCGTVAGGRATPVAAGGTCTDTSVYNAPYANSLIGQNVNFFGYFPHSIVSNNEPQFSAELKTSLLGTTVFLRPYSAVIDRYINGTDENSQPGYGTASGVPAGWYEVTNPANCQVQFHYNATPGTGGSSGPCFFGGNYTTPYVGTAPGQYPTRFKTTSVAPACSVATPCFTTPTNQNAGGYYGFNTPFSQPEVDNERGATLSILKPLNNNLFTFSFDYSGDDTTKYSGDTTPAPNGCFTTVRAAPNVPTVLPVGSTTPVANPYYQPNCQANGNIFPNLPSAALQIPSTQNYHYSTSLTALLQPTERLQIGIGGYYTFQRIFYQITNPAAAAAAAGYTTLTGATLAGAEQANATLMHANTSHSSVDPHVQLEYRVTPDLSLRANGGSSVTLPYNGLVSGLTALSVNAGPDGRSDVLSTKNPSLAPETTVAYDLGLDYRALDGTIISTDVYDNTIHNVWFSQSIPTANLPGRNPSQTLLSSTFNGPLERSYGAELTIQKNPSSGFGFLTTGSLDRAYYDQFGVSYYKSLCTKPAPPAVPVCSASAIVNGKQLDGTTGFISQVPFFHAAAEINWLSDSRRFRAALGDTWFGSNNATGGPPYFMAYANAYTTIGKGYRLAVGVQNLFNYNTAGVFYGQVAAFAGFNPIGAKYNPATGGIVDTHAFSSPNGIIVLPPRTTFLTLEKRI